MHTWAEQCGMVLHELVHMGVMWSMTFLRRPVEAWGALQGVASLARLSSGRPFKLMQCPAIKSALREWLAHHPRTQQDGAEFCAVVTAKLVGYDWGSYQARCQFEQPENHALHQPLLLQLPSGRQAQQPVTLQALVLEWHEASSRLQALTAGPELVSLQLERCSELNVKNRMPIRPPCRTVMLPVFCGDQLQVQWQEYTIRAMVIHRGERPSQGHFHTVLLDERQALMADDGSNPQPYQVGKDDERDLYIIWLVAGSCLHGECSVQSATISPVKRNQSGGNSLQQVLARFF